MDGDNASQSLFALFANTTDVNKSLLDTSCEGECDRYGTKYYTPFGSGVSLGDLTQKSLSKSCWSCESHNSRQVNASSDFPATNASTSVDSLMTKTVGVCKTEPAFEQNGGFNAAAMLDGAWSVTNDMSFKPQSSSRQQDVVVGRLNPSDSIPATHLATKTSSKSVSSQNTEKISRGGHVASRMKEREHPLVPSEQRPLVPSEQMFMRELDRLPPALRKQYVDYMIASHLGLLPPFACPQPCPPDVLYNVVVGPGGMPVTQLVMPPMMVPASPLMPAPLITVQPVVPSYVPKAAARWA